MFLVIDLAEGGDLRFHLQTNGGFTEDVLKVWNAEISLGVKYLHSCGIMHRYVVVYDSDLKPDNILLDGKGHIHITDFNIAVRFSPEKYPSSASGTMVYMGKR